ncbi:DUF305 domain-containing protein [Mycobacterium sp. M1]|uniref:DUF305 domain-containing protein n=1 Tax=Mycolicibacter acidiphilus TaxID=2835306 RepID=A0ABS5RG44_9MYCO|nr:DUF305 domain-containing protein [Mycolicibacter acidiphilus]MBS9533252.1 DUF305 domain-containing protein [Mycolicibacter acidiphilus]
MRSVAARRFAPVLTPVLVVGLTLGAGATVSSCRSTAAPSAKHSSTSTATTHSAEDVRFLQDMIEHHQQSIQLAMLVPSHTSNTALDQLAQQMVMTQMSEKQAFQAQLLQWEQELRSGDDAPVAGVADQATVNRLDTLHGPAFDTLWLQTMIANHRGGITLTRNEIEHGQSTDIIGVAHTVEATQQAGLDRMTAMQAAS